MVDFDRLKENAVITTEKPVQQPDNKWKYPVFIVREILPKEKEAKVLNPEDNSFRLITKKDLESMYLVSASLAHKDRLLQEQQKNMGRSFDNNHVLDPELMTLALAICKEAEPFYPELSPFFEAMDEGLVQKAKAFLQTLLEKETRVDQRTFTYKTHKLPERLRGQSQR